MMIGRKVRKLFKFLLVWKWLQVAILDSEFRDSVTIGLLRVHCRWYTPNLVHLGRTVLELFSKFQFCRTWPSWILKNDILTLPMYGVCQAKFGENWANGSRVIRVLVKFNMAAGGHPVFQISWFPVVGLLRMRRWCCVSNLVKIGFTVKKLLRFFFLIREMYYSYPKI